MEEARAVLSRLARIELLERGGAETGSLLAELSKLACEAAAWAERENDPRAREAAAALAAAHARALTASSRSTATVGGRSRPPTE
ncbi:MAG TPA: hypothetical protein VLW49_03255 [Gaiellaceae bacterium]|nr:hypothetical protein [Gaiellaceae bacterium]